MWPLIILFILGTVLTGLAQPSELENAIEAHRKGQITIRAKPGDRIEVEQLSHEFWFGCAIANGMIEGRWSDEDRRKYKDHFLQNFNAAVTENAVKWQSMEQARGNVNYRIVDGILEWTEENHIPLRGHNLFWGIPQFVQPWVKELADDELRAVIQNRAETFAAKYKGRFAEYDLNNEMIHGNYYEERLGPAITGLMAEWVHRGDPDAKFWVNDYDILTGRRLTDFMAHIRALLKQGVPIAGIGVQGHLHGDSFDREEVRRALDSLAVFDLPVRITEFNMPGQRSKYYREKIFTMTAEEEQQKAKDLVDYYRICFAHPAVTGILMWGFWEGANWIPVSSLYKKDWTPTPAATAYRQLVFSEWWTREALVASSDGMAAVKAFFGTYRITINGVSHRVDHFSTGDRAPVDFRRR